MSYPLESASKRRRRSSSEIAELYASFQQSGMSIGEYCRTHSVSRSSLAALVARRRKDFPVPPATAPSRVSAAPASFVPVEVVGSRPRTRTEESLHIELPNGMRISVERNFDAATLLRLLAVLERE